MLGFATLHATSQCPHISTWMHALVNECATFPAFAKHNMCICMHAHKHEDGARAEVASKKERRTSWWSVVRMAQRLFCVRLYTRWQQSPGTIARHALDNTHTEMILDANLLYQGVSGMCCLAHLPHIGARTCVVLIESKISLARTNWQESCNRSPKNLATRTRFHVQKESSSA